jgi:dGTPase
LSRSDQPWPIPDALARQVFFRAQFKLLAYPQGLMTTLSDRIKQANMLLNPLAIPHQGILGRRFDEPDDELRTPFQRDRDRILHSTALRRLQGKTQVFVIGDSDHFRTRLTHTLEVAQIARDIARALNLNEDVAECIALAHDIGHPPFGHRGEEALDTWMHTHGLQFEHNLHSFRIVTVLEKRSSLYEGLNLNKEIENGLLKHSSVHPIDGSPIVHSLEAQTVNIADEIAYTSHDCDDALNGNLFSLSDLLTNELAGEAYDQSKARGTRMRGTLVHILVHDVIDSSTHGSIQFSSTMRERLNELRSFLSGKMYLHPRVQNRAIEGQKIIGLLCNHYVTHPTEKILALGQRTGSNLPEAVKDYVAGMTDNFAWLQAAEEGLLEELTPEDGQHSIG